MYRKPKQVNLLAVNTAALSDIITIYNNKTTRGWDSEGGVGW